MTMEFFVHVDGTRFRVHRQDNPGHGGALEVEGESLPLELAAPSASPIRSIRLGGRSLRVLPRRTPDGGWTLDVEGHRYRAEVGDRGQEAVRQARRAAGGSGGLAPLKAPMPGMVVRVEVAPGDEVVAGQGLVIVEAMKMENELKATRPGRVRAVHAAAGTAVEKDTVLVEFEVADVEEAEAGTSEAETSPTGMTEPGGDT